MARATAKECSSGHTDNAHLSTRLRLVEIVRSFERNPKVLFKRLFYLCDHAYPMSNFGGRTPGGFCHLRLTCGNSFHPQSVYQSVNITPLRSALLLFVPLISKMEFDADAVAVSLIGKATAIEGFTQVRIPSPAFSKIRRKRIAIMNKLPEEMECPPKS